MIPAAGCAILLVEPDASTALALASAIEGCDYSVAAVADADLALAALQQDPSITLALFRIPPAGHPQVFQAARRLQQLRPLPLIFLLSDAAGEALDFPDDLPVYGCTAQNASPAVLAGAIRTALRLIQKRQPLMAAGSAPPAARSEPGAEAWFTANYDKLAPVFQHAPALMTISAVDDGRLLSVNEEFVRISGYSRAEAIGKTSVELGLLKLDDRARLVEQLRQEGRLAGIELTLTSRDGSPIECIYNGELIAIDGQTFLLSLAQDITGRIRAEAALKESAALYRALVDGLPDVIMRFDREGRHLFVSDSVRTVVAIDPAQFIGKNHRELGFSAKESQFWEDAIQQVFDRKGPVETEFNFTAIDGRKTFNWRLLPECDETGAIRSVLSISRDITAQRRAEQNYRTLFQQMLDGFALHEIICDENGTPSDYRFLAVNPAFERLTGLQAGDLLGRTVLEVLPATEKRWIETYGQVALTGEPVTFENYSGALQKHFTVTAFRPAPGQFAVIFMDITARKLAEEALQRQYQALQTAQTRLVQSEKLAAIGELVAGVAHELNNPLTSIVLYSQLLQAKAPPNRSNEELDKILTESRRAAKIVRGLLDFARQRPVELRPVQINTLLEDSLEILAYPLRTSNVIVELRLAPDLPLTNADSQQLQQVFMNLLQNARQAIATLRSSGRLVITTASGPSLFHEHDQAAAQIIRITIEDDGPGIPPALLPRIFDPFFTTKSVGEGTGLGLAVCHGIIAEHGGHIWAENLPAGGARFTLELPILATPPDLPGADGPAHPDCQVCANALILIIDDERAILDSAAMALRQVGYQVDTESDGAAALERLRLQSYDLIISDIRMPGLNGIDIYRQALQVDPRLSQCFLFITGDTVSLGTREFLKQNHLPSLEKPFDLDQLLEHIRLLVPERNSE